MAEPKNNYNIKPYRSEEENENRKLYRAKDNIRRKWFSICSDINEHGNKLIYEKCLVQAFNLTEFVMDNYIEQLFDAANDQNNLRKIEKPKTDEKSKKGKKEENGKYLFIKENVTIDFDILLGYGYSGKTQILEKLGHKLPEYIHEVRQNRNKYAHGTDTYKNSIRDEVNSYETIVRYMNTMGELLVMMKKMSPSQVNPSYEELKLQVGKAIGHEDKYVALTLICENEKERIFYGKNSASKRDICIYELVPTENILEVYHHNREELMKVTGSGIVRTEDVLLKNKTCYIVKEKIEGDTLTQYLRKQKNDIDVRKDMLYQVERIIRNICKYPNIKTELKETDLIVDEQGDLWLTRYELGKKQLSQPEFIRRYRLILGIEEERTEMPLSPQLSAEEKSAKEDEESLKTKVAEMKEKFAQANTESAIRNDLDNTEEVKLAKEKNIESKEQQYEEAPEAVWEPAVEEVKRETVRQEQKQEPKESIGKTTDAVVALEMGSNSNQWAKLWGTLGICGGILLILWAVSGLLA